MKYIDAEKLIAEIELLLKRNEPYCGNAVADGQRQALYQMKDFITSLQQEQPDNEDIDKVAQELYEHLYELKRRNNVPTNLYDKQEIIDLWKAGIEYGRNHPKQEQLDVDLEKEIEEHAIYMPHGEFVSDTERLEDMEWARKEFRHFYELGFNARK